MSGRSTYLVDQWGQPGPENGVQTSDGRVGEAGEGGEDPRNSNVSSPGGRACVVRAAQRDATQRNAPFGAPLRISVAKTKKLSYSAWCAQVIGADMPVCLPWLPDNERVVRAVRVGDSFLCAFRSNFSASPSDQRVSAAGRRRRPSPPSFLLSPGPIRSVARAFS